MHLSKSKVGKSLASANSQGIYTQHELLIIIIIIIYKT